MPARHGTEVARRLALGPEPGAARLQKLFPFRAPGGVLGEGLHRQPLRGRGPAELRPAPPVVADAPDQALHLPVARAVPLVLRQHGIHEAAHVLWQVLDLRQRRSPRHDAAVARQEEGRGIGLLALPQELPPVRRQRRERLGVHGGGRGEVDPERLQRPLFAARARLQVLHQGVAIVGQQQERFGDPAERDMEKRAVGPAAGVQHGDRPPRGAALRGVHGRTVCVIEMAQLRIGQRETELAVPVAKAHPPVIRSPRSPPRRR